MTYPELPAPPTEFAARAVLIRMLDGLIYRYQCALYDLDDGFLQFRSCDGAMSAGEVLAHVYQMSAIFKLYISGENPAAPAVPAGIAALRDGTVGSLAAARARILQLSDEEIMKLRFHRKKTGNALSIYYFISGPIADALTHVGQITAWRRQYGKPILKFDYFEGLPPAV